MNVCVCLNSGPDSNAGRTDDGQLMGIMHVLLLGSVYLSKTLQAFLLKSCPATQIRHETG